MVKEKDKAAKKKKKKKGNAKQRNPKKAQPGKAQAAPPIDYSPLIPMEPSAALAEIVGPDKLLHAEASRRVWIYIKRNRLLDRQNPLLINADPKLRPIFGKAQVTRAEMTRAVMAELKKG